ncbi:Purine catabolism protein PucG [bacterium HR30]|nr:Purine catabolism protein PucG [bacterium HR30]
MVRQQSFPPPQRLLLGPGPSMVHPRVLQAMSTPLVGHLDPAFLTIMEENKRLLRWLFGTANEITIPISGTGSAGMETSLVNLLEPGDEAIVCVKGLFGQRMAEVARRCGAQVKEVQAPWGRIVDAADVRTALRGCRKPKVLAVVHAETSTGVLQPLADLATLAREHEALFVVDTVTSLGGHPVRVDDWGIDVAYSGTQKCLSAPPGLAPVTVSPAALSVIHQRRQPVQSWYLDVSLLSQYWGTERVYHHTAPISMNYALLEALRLIEAEGLEARWQRHKRNHEALAAGLNALGIEFASQEGHRLWTLNCIGVPEGVDETGVRRALLDEFGIEIGAGLGPFKGRTWRIGLMGESSTAANVLAVLSALECVLPRFGFRVEAGIAVAAAQRVLAQAKD